MIPLSAEECEIWSEQIKVSLLACYMDGMRQGERRTNAIDPGSGFRVTLPALDEYVSFTPRLVTPVCLEFSPATFKNASLTSC